MNHSTRLSVACATVPLAILIVLVMQMQKATAAPLAQCSRDVSDTIDTTDDEHIRQVARGLQSLPKECLVLGVEEALRNGPDWRAIVAVNELRLQDARLLEALIDILIVWPPDGGFQDLVNAMVLQARGGGKLTGRLAALLESTARRETGLPRETAAFGLGAAGRSAYPYIERLLRVANTDREKGVREAAQAAAMDLIKDAIVKGDRVVLTTR